MGSSFSEYKGRGFWARDQVLQYWLRTVADTIELTRDANPLLHRIKDAWLAESQVGGSGCVDPQLDTLAAEPQVAQQLLLPILERALGRIGSPGEYVPTNELNEKQISGLTDWHDDAVPRASLEKVANAFIELVTGRLKAPQDGNYYALHIPSPVACRPSRSRNRHL